MELARSFSLNISENYVALDYSAISFDDPPKFIPYKFEVIDWVKWGHFMDSYWHVSILAGALYLVTIFGLKAYMTNRKPYDLRRELFLWNFSLGLFSIIGLSRTIPGFLSILSAEDGFYKSVCVASGVNMPMMFWSFIFMYSKYVELGDTVFIILRKKPLVFLQWYHHIATLVFTWLMGPLLEPISMYYVVMNYAVHSLMYPYFAAKALGAHVPRWISNIITTCQLAQMFFGFFVNVYTVYLIRNGTSCRRFPFSIYGSFLVYGSFIFLFGKLFADVVSKSRLICINRKTDHKKFA